MVILGGYLVGSLELFVTHYNAARPSRIQLQRFCAELHHIIGAAQAVLSRLAASEHPSSQVSHLIAQAREHHHHLLTRLAVLCSPLQVLVEFLCSGELGGPSPVIPNAPQRRELNEEFDPLREFTLLGQSTVGFEEAEFRLAVDWLSILRGSSFGLDHIACWATQRSVSMSKC